MAECLQYNYFSHGIRRRSIFVEIYQWWKGSTTENKKDFDLGQSLFYVICVKLVTARGIQKRPRAYNYE